MNFSFTNTNAKFMVFWILFYALCSLLFLVLLDAQVYLLIDEGTWVAVLWEARKSLAECISGFAAKPLLFCLG